MKESNNVTWTQVKYIFLALFIFIVNIGLMYFTVVSESSSSGIYIVLDLFFLSIGQILTVIVLVLSYLKLTE